MSLVPKSCRSLAMTQSSLTLTFTLTRAFLQITAPVPGTIKQVGGSAPTGTIFVIIPTGENMPERRRDSDGNVHAWTDRSYQCG